MEISSRTYRQSLPACWQVLAQRALLFIALLLRSVDVLVLRLDERLGDIILAKSLGFALVVSYSWSVCQRLSTIGLHSCRQGWAIAIVADLTLAAFDIATAVQLPQQFDPFLQHRADA